MTKGKPKDYQLLVGKETSGQKRQEASGIGKNRHLLSNCCNYPHSSYALFLLAFPHWPELAVELA